MKHLKLLGLAAMSAITLMMFVGAGAASATTLEVGGVTRNESISITASLKSGTTAVTKSTLGILNNTCNQVHTAGSSSTYTGTPTGATSELTFSGCDHTVTIHNPGQIYVEWTSGTNGRVYSENADVTSYSTIHGTHLRCTTPGAGLPIGTLTGTASGHAELHINAVISCSPHVNSVRVEGTLVVTSPTGLGVSA